MTTRRPPLLDPLDTTDLKSGLTFFLAVLLTGLFYQGAWQRVFAALAGKVRSLER